MADRLVNLEQDERWLDEEAALAPAAAEADPIESQGEPDQSDPSAREVSARVDSGQASNLPDWPALARSLNLGGRLGQFMRQSECISASKTTFKLRVPIAPLADQSVVDRAQQAVSEYLGRTITLEVSVGTIEGDTAAGRDRADEQLRLAQARETIEADPFIQTLLEEFDGQIVPDSIRALDPEPTQQPR